MTTFFSQKTFRIVTLLALLGAGISGAVRASAQPGSTIYISGEEGSYQSGGLITQASTQAPRITIGSSEAASVARVTIYEARHEDLLAYLTYDDKSQQTLVRTNVSSLRTIGSLNVNLDSDNSGYYSSGSADLPINQTGIWLLRVSIGGTERDAFLVRSKTGTYVTEGNDQFIFWGQDFSTRRSVASGSVTLYALKNKPVAIAEGQFGADGIARTGFTSDADIAIVNAGEDYAVIPINLRYLNASYSHKTFTEQTISKKYFLFTDRPLYKPGDTIFFKGIVREWNDIDYSVPSQSVRVRIFDGSDYEENRPLFNQVMPLGRFGSVSGFYTLKQEDKTGYYRISISPVNVTRDTRWFDSASASFRVEHYRKPEYSIEIESPTTEIIKGTPIQATISGTFFSGQPLAGKQVSYKIYKSYAYHASADEISDDYRYGYWHGDEVAQGQVTLDGRGRANISVESRNFEGGLNSVIAIEAQVIDQSSNPSFARKNILLFAGAYDIISRDYRYAYPTNVEARIPIQIIPHTTTRLDGIRLSGSVEYSYWSAAPNPGFKYPTYVEHKEFESPITAVTNKDGVAIVTFTPKRHGSYNVTLEGKDAAGNKINYSIFLYASDSAAGFFDYRNRSSVQVVLDKKSYEPGDTALVTLSSEVPDSDIFVSLERDYTSRFFVERLIGNTKTISVPVVEADMPNIFVHAAGFGNGNLQSTSEKLTVSAERKRIVVDLRTDKKTYKPGERVTLDITTKDRSGVAVPAELAVFVVDKALFELTQSERQNIFDTFWLERYDSTSHAHSLEGISVFGGAEKGGGEGGGARDAFEDTAYWNPSVVTGSSGTARISFDLPDNLTTWAITGIAANERTQVGENKAEVMVAKELVVRPNLPNILRAGDNAILSAYLQNNTDAASAITASLTIEGAVVTGTTTLTAQVSPHAEELVSWNVEAHTPSDRSRFTFSATDGTKKLRDAVAAIVPIRAFGFKEYASFARLGPATIPLAVHPDTDPERSKIRLDISPTLVGSLPAAMEYLVDYPYGCVEQTTSRFVPAVIALGHRDLFADALAGKDIKAIVGKGIERLRELQLTGGGWSWWYDANPDPFVTAYVGEYLHAAEEMGIPVDSEMKNRLSSYASFISTKRDAGDAERISGAYLAAIIGAGPRTLVETHKLLDADLLALAVMANVRNGYADPASNGLNLLIQNGQASGDALVWRSLDSFRFSSDDASTALAVRALLAAPGHRDIAAKGVLYLTRSRQNGYWSNTFATAQVIRALTDFAQTGNELAPNYSFTVTQDGKTIATGTMRPQDKKAITIQIPLSSILPSGSTIAITQNGTGQLYSTLVIEEFRTDKAAAAASKGMSITRSYANQDGSPNIKIGDTVTVTLELNDLIERGTYGVIEDELPGGLIPVNASFENEQFSRESGNYYYGGYPTEITENGVIIAAYEFPAGSSVYSYEARAVAEGSFSAPPAIASLMYAPEIYARTASETVTIHGPDYVDTFVPAHPFSTSSGKTAAVALAIAFVIALAAQLRRASRL